MTGDRIGGVDGCRGGWFRVERLASGEIEPAILSTEELFASGCEFSVLTIDIPIGLPDVEPREVDRAARRLLAPRASSVFPAPVRAALDGVTYADACERSFAACGKKLSQQGFGILAKIREVDRCLRADEELARRVREVHPEVCFLFMNGAKPMPHPKKSLDGAMERLRLLEAHFGPVYSGLRAAVPTRYVASDDIVDALAALWSAERFRDGTHHTLPDTPSRDRFGLRMEMVA